MTAARAAFPIASLVGLVMALIGAGAAGSTGPAPATSHQAGASCTAVGTWVHVTTDIGSTTWTIDAGGRATETGIGNATGTAALAGQTLTITFVASDTVTTGVYSWTLGPDCRSGSGTLSFTGPPSRVGETHASTLTKTGGPQFASPPPPQIVPRTTRPVPGVVTSYAAPRPGAVAALPFPAAGCAAPAASAARESATPAHEECHVDILLTRKGGDLIQDPDAVFAGGLVVSDENSVKAWRLCETLIVGRLASLGDADLESELAGQIGTCIVTVSRILQRAEDLRLRRERTPNERSATLMARRCRLLAIRLKGSARGASPVTTTCRRTAKGVRIAFRPARAGRSIGSLIRPSSKIVVGRSHAVRSRPGDRIDVLWTVTPPP